MAWKPKPRLIHMGRDNDQSYDDVALNMKDDVALNIIKMHIRVLHPLTQEDVRSALADRSPSDQATLVYELIMALERRRLTQMLLNQAPGDFPADEVRKATVDCLWIVYRELNDAKIELEATCRITEHFGHGAPGVQSMPGGEDDIMKFLLFPDDAQIALQARPVLGQSNTSTSQGASGAEPSDTISPRAGTREMPTIMYGRSSSPTAWRRFAYVSRPTYPEPFPDSHDQGVPCFRTTGPEPRLVRPFRRDSKPSLPSGSSQEASSALPQPVIDRPHNPEAFVETAPAGDKQHEGLSSDSINTTDKKTVVREDCDTGTRKESASEPSTAASEPPTDPVDASVIQRTPETSGPINASRKKLQKGNKKSLSYFKNFFSRSKNSKGKEPDMSNIDDLTQSAPTDEVTYEEIIEARQRGIFDHSLSDEEVRDKLLEIKRFAAEAHKTSSWPRLNAASRESSRRAVSAELSSRALHPGGMRADGVHVPASIIAEPSATVADGDENATPLQSPLPTRSPPPIPIINTDTASNDNSPQFADSPKDGEDYSARTTTKTAESTFNREEEPERDPHHGLSARQPTGLYFNPLRQHPVDYEEEKEAFEKRTQK